MLIDCEHMSTGPAEQSPRSPNHEVEIHTAIPETVPLASSQGLWLQL